MKLLAALSYAIAISAGQGSLLPSLGVAFCVFVGTLCAFVAIGQMIDDRTRLLQDFIRDGRTVCRRRFPWDR